MKHIKKLVGLGIFALLSSAYKVQAVTVWTLKDSQETEHKRTQVDGSRSILDIISLVNDYLWFAIGCFCFIFMIWNGFKLISANGDDKAMGSAKKALIGSGIGLAVSLLAYIIVNLAVRLFS